MTTLEHELHKLALVFNTSTHIRASVVDGFIYLCLDDGEFHTDTEIKEPTRVAVSLDLAENLDSWMLWSTATTSTIPMTRFNYKEKLLATCLGRFNHMQATAILAKIRKGEQCPLSQSL